MFQRSFRSKNIQIIRSSIEQKNGLKKMEKNENFEQQLLLDKVHRDQKKILPSFCPLGKKGAD
jgi:hypothetical protein